MVIYFTLFTGATAARPWENPAFLSTAELQRLPPERFEKRRHEWLLGRWNAKQLLRKVEPACANLPLPSISIENEPGGAPFVRLAGQPNAHPACISISHSQNYALCALSGDLTIGADLEKVEPRSKPFIEDYLTAAEARAARALSAADQHLWVTLVWSAKEAALKTLRIGLRADTRSVEIMQTHAPGADGWSLLEMRSALPGAENLRGWWRQEHGFVLTITTLTEHPEAVVRYRVT